MKFSRYVIANFFCIFSQFPIYVNEKDIFVQFVKLDNKNTVEQNVSPTYLVFLKF